MSPEKQAAIAKNDAPPSPENAKVTTRRVLGLPVPLLLEGRQCRYRDQEEVCWQGSRRVPTFPLSFHDKAHVAAEAALAAHAQGKFWSSTTKCLRIRMRSTAPTSRNWRRGGLKVDAFKKALDDKSFAAAVDADMKMATEVGVQGTPSIFLNGKKVQNATDTAASRR